MALEIPGSLRLLLPNGTARAIRLEEYVAGVVTASLPAGAPLEALKAQAVAARTFAAITRRHLEHGAEVCTLRHCQLWRADVSSAARLAVEATRGIVAAHAGAPIDAYYFDHCDGTTRDAADILVDPHPYLQSVTCPCGFASLRGHGIGMCQRGALVMARYDETYEAILKHYYTGVDLVTAPVFRRRPLPAVSVPKVEPKPEDGSQPVPQPPSTPENKPIRAKRSTARPARAAGKQPVSGPVASAEQGISARPAAASATPPEALARDGAEEPAPPPSILESPPSTAAMEADHAETPVTPPAESSPGVTTQRESPASPGVLPPGTAASASPQAEHPADLAESEWYPTAEEFGPAAASPIDAVLDEALYLAAGQAQDILPELRGPAPILPPAPDSMPEEIPHFPPLPPARPLPAQPPASKTVAGSAPAVLVDFLPGPRVIAGDLARPGIIVTIRDREGHAVITVSGTAPQHGPGGFEAPLPGHGLYTLSFDGEQVEVRLRDETVFVTYGN